ncbi:uncharacterized protein LOC126741926 [Anthonomus grandis grandis]|uniref:uncharacterized protein LOC126741926 n=1 Tax=Anthonomus grandis grandis TaxID=2921223 RepID=UPI0021663AB5|nr:uncharacterized protein LOC126741926 [Anthonomus grandis grandis]
MCPVVVQIRASIPPLFFLLLTNKTVTVGRICDRAYENRVMMGRELLLMMLMLLTVAVGAEELQESQQHQDDSMEEMEIYKMAMDFMDECGSKEWSLCLKERALRYMETLPNELDIGGAVKIIPNGRISRKNPEDQLPEEPRAREDAVDSILWNRISDYLSSHTIELRVPPDTLQEINESVEEGRGKGGGGGGGKKGGGGGGDRMKGLMMLIQLKAAVLGAIALKFVALVAFKALLIAKIALVLASVIALKKLLEQKHHTSTYEVVAHPPHHEGWDGHYDRSFTQEQLAYRGYEGAARSKTV